MDNLFKMKCSDIYKKIKDAIKNKDYSKILDYLVLIAFCSAVLFVVVYKVEINIEEWLWGTNVLVLSSRVKGQLLQLMLYFLPTLSFLKWILAVRTGKPVINKIEERNELVSFTIKNKKYVIQKSTLYLLGLIFIIFFFIVRKIPYWHIPFTHNHPLKYNTYVDPALSMLKENDPFFYQVKYMHNPITNSLGVGQKFGNLPLLEWLLFGAYKIFSRVLTLEAITRMVMIIIGSFGLIFCYSFLKKAFNKGIALITVLLLSINAIFNLSFFVTVYDALSFCLTFAALSLLLESINKDSIKKLVFSAVLIGIGCSIKENILLWSLPTVFMFVLLNHKKSLEKVLSKMSLYMITVMGPYIITKVSISHFPQKETQHYLLLVVLTIFFSIYVLNTKCVYTFLKKVTTSLIEYVRKHKMILWLIPVFVVLAIKLVYSTTVSEEFLTDWHLIINPDLYLNFINRQIIPYIGRYPFYIFLMSIPLFVYYNKNSNFTKSFLSLIFGSLFYLVLASKSLFFHSYYWLFIITSMTTFIAWGIYFIINSFYKGWSRIIYAVLFIGTLFVGISPSVTGKLNRKYMEILDVVEYINSEELEEGTSFFDQANVSYLTIKTDLYRVYSTEVFANQEFKDSVQEIGFIETMRKYKILYVVAGESISYQHFAPAFIEQNLEYPSSVRTKSIFAELYSTDQSVDNYQDLKNLVIEENHLEDQFKLIKDFYQFKVYKLTEACFPTVIK